MSNTPNTRTSTRRLNLNYKDPTGGNYDRSKDKSVNMTFPALFSYVMNTNYRSMSGILGLVLSFGAIVMLVIGWNTTSGRQKAIFIIVALMFTVINPLSLAFKTFKQLKTSPSYKQPLVYTFGDDGIGVSQGEEHMDLEWKGVYRLLMTKYMLAVYTTGCMHL